MTLGLGPGGFTEAAVITPVCNSISCIFKQLQQRTLEVPVVYMLEEFEACQ